MKKYFIFSNNAFPNLLKIKSYNNLFGILFIFFLSLNFVLGQYVMTSGTTCGNGGTPYGTPYIGSYTGANYTSAKTVRYSTTENIYAASEFDDIPYGIHSAIGYYHCSGSYNNSGTLSIYLKTVPTSTTAVGTTASTSGYTLVYRGSPNAIAGNSSFGWKEALFNGGSFSGAALNGAANGSNTFFWTSNTHLSVLIIYDSGTSSAQSSIYHHTFNTAVTDLSSIYTGNSSSPWGDGTSTMTKHRKPRVRLNLISPLSVTVTEFEATTETQGIKLNWTTESELDNDYFSLYRSADGVQWTEIGQVDGAGNSFQQKKYEFTDYMSYRNSDELYYKLRQTDFDGKFEEYGPIVVMNRNNSLTIYPNPSSDYIFIPGDQTFEIFDVRGLLVKTKKSSDGLYNIKDLPNGIYIVKFQDGEIQRFVKH